MVVGMVSRLEPRKGYRYFFEALARVSEDFPQVRALVVGEGEQGHELKSMAADLGIGERVVFAGYRADIAEVIAAFDVALLTSLWEGLPRVLVQYALLEKPIVTFDVEGAREVIDDGNSGYIVPLQDVDLLADRLRQLLESETLRRRLGVAARERVEGRWDVDRMVAGIAEVYRRVESARIPEKELSASR